MKGIDGFFSEDEGRWYARFARALVGGIFVEIGSWKGRSTSFVGPVCNANGTRLVCIDHWSGSRDTLADRYSAALILAGHDYDGKHTDLCAAVDAFAKANDLHVRRGPRSIFWLE